MKTATALCVVTLVSALVGVGLQAQTPGVGLKDALALIDAAHKEATAQNLRLSVAVVDARGDLVAVARLSGAPAATADTAIGKAMVSALFGQPSATLAPRATSPVLQGLNERTGGRFRFFQGALPIVRNGRTVGAVGASGATAQQDEDIVRTALAAVFR
jgi:glc operon protein GlcG